MHIDKDMEKHLTVLTQEYDSLAKTAEKQIILDSKKLDTTLLEQVNLQFKWQRLYSRVYSAFESAKTEAEYNYSVAFNKSVQDRYKDVTSTEAKFAASGDEKYIYYKRLENKFFRIKKDVEAVVDVIESRKYILKDLSMTIVNGCNGTILDG